MASVYMQIEKIMIKYGPLKLEKINSTWKRKMVNKSDVC